MVPQVGDEEDDVSSQVALVLWYLVENVGRSTTMSFCGDVSLFFLAFSPQVQLERIN